MPVPQQPNNQIQTHQQQLQRSPDHAYSRQQELLRSQAENMNSHCISTLPQMQMNHSANGQISTTQPNQNCSIPVSSNSSDSVLCPNSSSGTEEVTHGYMHSHSTSGLTHVSETPPSQINQNSSAVNR